MVQKHVTFESLLGVTLAEILVGKAENEIVFTARGDNRQWRMYHTSDCCESVAIDDIVGDINDLIGSPIITAEESTDIGRTDNDNRFMWTFYHIATQKGTVTLKWYGESNGYYSEAVDLYLVRE